MFCHWFCASRTFTTLQYYKSDKNQNGGIAIDMLKALVVCKKTLSDSTWKKLYNKAE